jgi:hypothetical protein
VVTGVDHEDRVIADHDGRVAAHDRLAGRLDEGVDAIGDLHRLEGKGIRRGRNGRPTPRFGAREDESE